MGTNTKTTTLIDAPHPTVQKTAFGEALSATLTPQVQLTFVYNLNPKIVTTTVVDTGTVTVANSILSCSTGIGATGAGVMESNRILRYGAGQGGLVRFTAIFDTPAADSTQIIGIGDDLDGFYIGYDGLQFGVLRRDAGVDHWTHDGTFIPPTDESRPMPTKSLLGRNFQNNPQLGNIYQIRYQWLGFGAITFSTEDPDTGELIGFHTIRYANSAATPTIRNPQLPLCVNATNTGNTTDITVKAVSMMGAVEGNPIDTGVLTSVAESQLATAAEVPMFTIRAKDTFQGVKNRVESILLNLAISLDAGGTHQFRVYFNAVPTSPSYADVDATTSTLEIDTAAVAFTGGNKVFDAFVSGSELESFDVQDFGIRFRRLDTLLVTIERITGSAGTASVSVTLSEIF